MEETLQAIGVFVGAVLLGVVIIVAMSFRARNRSEERAKSKARRAEFLRSLPETSVPGALTILRVAVALSLFWALGTVLYSGSAALVAARAGGSLLGPASALFFAATPLLVGGIAVFHTVVAIAFFRRLRWVPRLLSGSLPMVLAGPFLIEDANRSPVVLGTVIAVAFSLSIALQRSRSLWWHCGWTAEDAHRLGD